MDQIDLDWLWKMFVLCRGLTSLSVLWLQVSSGAVCHAGWAWCVFGRRQRLQGEDILIIIFKWETSLVAESARNL